MSAQMEVTKTRLKRLLDDRKSLNELHETIVLDAEKREGDKDLTEVEEKTRAGYAARMEQIDKEVNELHDVLKREEESAKISANVRAHLAGREGGGEVDQDGVYKYGSFAAYARDRLIVERPQYAQVDSGVRESARERLTRAPEHTLSSNVAGLMPAQHISQIMEVIDKSRPVVTSARRSNLNKGVLTFPHVDQKPEVLLQGTEKTEGGTANLQISMATMNAQTFIGGGNLSWQTIEWSDPDALALWFDIQGERYARATEGTACAVLTACGTANRLGTADRIVTGGTATYQDWLSGIVLGFQEVYENSGALSNTLYLSPDMFFLAAALTSDSGAVLIQNGGISLNTLGGNIAGVNVVTSYGFAPATAIVGDATAFLAAETPGAPVQLRAVEPAIGGLEVGVIGAFAAACYDDNRFSKIT